MHPDSTTAAPGVRVLPDTEPTRVYSSHGCCALNDGRAHDAFDIFRILDHGGDQGAAIKAAARMLGMDRERADTAEPREPYDYWAKPRGQEGEDTAEPPPPMLRRVDMANLMATRPPVRWAIEGYLPRGLVTLLGAHGGMGKSNLALALAAHVACGRDWAGRAAFYGKALYVSLEDDASMALGRLRKIVLTYDLRPETVAANITLLDGTATDGALAVEAGKFDRRLIPTPVMGEVRAAAADHALIVIDNASDGFGGNENDRAQVRQFMRLLADMAREFDAAVLLLAHIDKMAARNGSQGNSYSGSTAWHNSARSRLAIAQDPRTKNITLVQEKLNIGVKAHPLPLAWENAVLVPGTPSKAPEAEGEADTTAADAEAVLAALEAAEAACVNVPPGRSGPSTAFLALGTFGLPAELRGAKGKDRFWTAMNALLNDGRARVEDYRTGDRKDRQRVRQCRGRANAEGRARETDAAPESAPMRARQYPLYPMPSIGALAQCRAPNAPMSENSTLAHIGALAQPSVTVGIKGDPEQADAADSVEVDL